MSSDWSTIGKVDDGWEPVINTPAGEGVPFTDPQELVAQSEAQVAEAQAQKLRDWKLANIKRQISPIGAMARSAANEVAQPFLGAADLLGSETALDTANELQGEISQIGDVYPKSVIGGSMIPYLGTGAGATVAYMKGVNKLRTGFMQNRLANPIASSVIPGAIEGGTIGALSPQQDALSGAALAGGGAYIGQKIIGPLAAGATNLSPYAKEMLKISKDWDMRQMPGAKSGNTGFMKVDDALIKAGDLDYIPAEQNSIITRKVLGVAGLDADNIVPGQMYKHRKELGKQYNVLDRKSTPIFSDKTIDDLATSKQAFIDLNLGRSSTWANKLEEEFLSLADEGDEIPLTAYTGFKNSLKNQINNFEKIKSGLSTEQGAARSMLMDYQSILRGTMRNGSTDPKILKKRDALDSKFAATRFLEENKIMDSGSVDYKKLYNSMSTKMPGQLNAMTGPWADMAKAAKLGQYIEDSTVSTLGAHQQINQVMGARRNKGVIGALTKFGAPRGIIPDAMAALYQATSPRKGLMHLPQTAPLMSGGPAGSALSRSLMERNR